ACILGTKGAQVYVKSLNDTIIEQFEVKGNTVSSIATTNTGLVAVAGYSSEVVIYNLHLKKIETRIDSGISNSIVTSLDISDDGNIAIGSKEQDMGIIRVYKIASKALVTTYSNLEISVVSVHFILNETTILAIDGAATLKAFKINEDGSNLENLSAKIGACGDVITAIFITPDFDKIIFGTARGAVLSFKIETE
ncbi:MAG: WD40 repeat domain-containing protein, partial [Candidatus Heimdallarchaeota archaeon]|nr:WD40 repeat domain-containing protein [Candidatus Heimdallarchaeota archaeon]